MAEPAQSNGNGTGENAEALKRPQLSREQRLSRIKSIRAATASTEEAEKKCETEKAGGSAPAPTVPEGPSPAAAAKPGTAAVGEQGLRALGGEEKLNEMLHPLEHPSKHSLLSALAAFVLPLLLSIIRPHPPPLAFAAMTFALVDLLLHVGLSQHSDKSLLAHVRHTCALAAADTCCFTSVYAIVLCLNGSTDAVLIEPPMRKLTSLLQYASKAPSAGGATQTSSYTEYTMAADEV